MYPMIDESRQFRMKLYAVSLLHGVGDAAIIFLPVCFLLMGCHVLVDRVWGEQPLVEIVLSGFGVVLLIATGVRAARIAARSRVTQRRRLLGQCLYCGYDLRASTEQCPECGRSIRAARYGSRA